MNTIMITKGHVLRNQILFFTIILLVSLVAAVVASGGGGGGGGGVVLPFPQPPVPSPAENNELIFADQRLAVVYPVIQIFKNLIISDPFNITASWVGSDVCNYRGFYCEPPPDNTSATALASIDFNGFQLTASTLDGFLDQLPDLALFHANSNKFAGIISPNIAKLPYLYELDISNNKFSGPFPTAILAMEGLSFLDIRFNFFSGSVPAQLYSKTLDALFINNNNFVAKLPENIINTHIFYLTLANNKFFGPIPRSIARDFSDLSEILLLNNLLTGCLPYELGLLKNVVVFDAGNNHLTGRLPFSLGCLQKLEILNFAGNFLYGNVPKVLCGLGNLANLSLSDNYFTQVAPVCWKLMKNGVLDVKKNCIPGLPFQRSLAECAAFFAHPRYCPNTAMSYAHISCSTLRVNDSELAPSPF